MEEKAEGAKNLSPTIKTEEKLLIEAMKAYGIERRYVLASRVENGQVTILTHGGSRVRYRSGEQVMPLDAIAVTGINPKKRKPITGGGKL